MTGRAPLPPRLPAVFSVDAARRAGVSVGRLRAQDLDLPFRGVRARRTSAIPKPPAHDESPAARRSRELRREVLRLAEAYALVAAPGAFFSHGTAAAIWDLPVPLRILRAAARRLDVAVSDERRSPKGARINGHHLRSDMTQVRAHGGLPVTSAATTWTLLAPDLDLDELIEVGDAIAYVPRRRGMVRGALDDALATAEQLDSAMNAGRRRGVGAMRRALPLIRTGAASPGETKVRLACVRAGLPEPELDLDVFDARGHPIGFTELGFRAYSVLVEYEGDHHRVDRTR